MNDSGYSGLTKLFHTITLGSKLISEVSFEVEKNLFKKNISPGENKGKNLFVSGLARSGTTILMRRIYETGQFASLTYDDMPLALAPNLWRSLSFGKKNTELKERAHHDGILINNISPEALDEIFWKVFLHDNYIQNDRLLINILPEDLLEKYDTYIELITHKKPHRSGKRYLSKNNNSVLRLDSLLKYFPDSVVVIPFRDPLQHSLSLLTQHLNFTRIQSKDRFTLKYMNWIGHHEFGLNQKPFYLNDEQLFGRMLSCDKTTINYWLLSWLNYYSYIAENFAGKAILFPYEKFCKSPSQMLSQLFEYIDVLNPSTDRTPFNQQFRSCSGFDDQILKSCNSLYQQLSKTSSDYRFQSGNNKSFCFQMAI